MGLLTPLEAFGDSINLVKTHAKHLSSVNAMPENGGDGGFASMLMKAVNGVNDLELQSDSLSAQMITDPDSVDVHDVTIAMAKANLAVSLTKSVVDRAIQAYTNIINIR